MAITQLTNVGSYTFKPSDTTVVGTATHYANYGVGGLKQFNENFTLSSDKSIIAGNYAGTWQNLNIDKIETGSITYLQYYNKYYMWSGSAWQQLEALTTGTPNFSSGLTASGIYVTSLGNIFLDGGNVETTGTASFSSVTASAGFKSSGTSQLGTLKLDTDLAVSYGGTGRGSFTLNGVLYGNNTNGLLATAQGAANSVLIANAGAPSFSTNLTLGGNIQALGTASFEATTVVGLKSNGTISGSSTLDIIGAGTFGGLVSAVTGFTSSTGYIQIGGGATSSTGFYSPGTSNLTTLNVSTISSSGLATLTDLYVPGNTQLGNAATDTTSVFGTLSIVNAGSISGSITCDSSGNLIFDGSGAGGVEITDGLMYLGSIPIQSGSYGGPSYNGGMISSSMKVVALHGFANRTSDGDASFEVDTAGNLQCYSLKETSLRAYKHEIQYITESQLQNISKLKPLTFLYNIDNPEDVNDPQLRQAGFIAEQVQQIYPEVAWYKEGKLAGLQYQRLTAYLTKGIQQLIEKNEKLQKRLNKKDKDVTKLNSRVNQLEDLVEDLLRRFSQQ